MPKHLKSTVKDLKVNNQAWRQSFKEIALLHKFNMEEDDALVPSSYGECLKYGFKYLVVDTENVYKMITDKGIVTLVRPDSEWDWRNNEEYWKDEYHLEGMFNEPIPHLISVFFFKPLATAKSVKKGSYRLLIRHCADSNCNLQDQAHLSVKARPTSKQESSWIEVF